MPDGLSGAAAEYLKEFFDNCDGTLPIRNLHDVIMREVEAGLLEQTLIYTGGNQKKAAEILGLNRNTVRKKIADYKIKLDLCG